MKRRAVALAGLVLAVVLVGTAVLFVWPPVAERPVRADAVVVLAGDPGRLPTGRSLVSDGSAPTLALSDPDQAATEVARLCADADAAAVVCFTPEPAATRGEARALAATAAEHRWDALVVVTSTHHVTRARVLIEQCYGGRVTMVSSGFKGAWPATLGRIAREWVALAAAMTVRRAC